MENRLTAQDAAKILGYHINHVYRLLRAKVIEAEQFNGVWVIPRSEIERIKRLQSEQGRLPKGILSP